MPLRRRQGEPAKGFTLIEVLVVVVILAITGAVVVPLMMGTGDVEAISAARVISADLQYAQNVAITKQDIVTVAFDTGAESYDLSSNASGTLKHPMTNLDYVVNFSSQESLGRVDVVSADFAGSASVAFDELGSPDSGGSVTVQVGPHVYRVDVAPVTGAVTVTPVGS